MNRIPVQQTDSEPQRSKSSAYLPEALETLLLGGIWWFVLIWLPLLQPTAADSPLAAGAPLLFRVEALVSAAISLVVIGLRISDYALLKTALRRRELLLLALIAAAGIGNVVWLIPASDGSVNNPVYAVAFQGILALAYFLARRSA